MARYFFFIGTEVTQNVRTTKLVVECSTTQRPIDHDVQRTDDTAWLTKISFPWLTMPRNLQVRYCETTQTSFRFGTTASCAFITDFTTRTSCCARERRNCSWMVVGFHFHQNMDRFLMILIFASFRAREETTRFTTHHNCSVIFIRRQDIVVMLFKRIFDHLEQGFVLLLTINRPVSIENLMTTVLRVSLRKHIKFNIVRITAQLLEAFQQIIDFIFCQRQTQFDICFRQRITTTGQYINRCHWARFVMSEQRSCCIQISKHTFHHPVMQ